MLTSVSESFPLITNKMSFNQPFDFCLLIPVYNNEEGLLRSLASVRYESNRFLIVIVDDGSDAAINGARCAAVVTGLPPVLLRLPQNGGITAALNHGLQWIYNQVKVRYIARLDAGDICAPERFTEQVAAMDSDAACVLSGTWCRFIDSEGNGYTYKTATDDKSIVRGMHFRNLFIHPTMMFRVTTDPAGPFYPAAYPLAEDYALAWNLMQKGRVVILPKILVYCELNEQGLSATHRGKQLKSRADVIRDIAVNNNLKIVAYCYLFLLRIVPKRLILRLKHWNG